MLVVSKLDDRLNMCCSAGESIENSMDVGTLLHGDYTELIFFVDPDEESLFFVVENTSAVGPVAIEASNFEETVSLPKNV